MVDVDEFSGNATKLYNSIEKVRIVRGVLEEDPITWKLYIMGQVLKIPAEKLESQGVFRAQYIRAFNYPAPKIKSDEWDNIILALAQDKSEIVAEIEESDSVYIARQMLEEIKKIPIADDEETASIGRCLLKRCGLYYLISKKIEEMIVANGYKITANKLSPTMYQLGMKTEGTENPYINKKRVRAWAFHLELIENNE